MSKTADHVARALKLKAEAKPEALTIRQGAKKHSLPFEVRTLISAEYMFVHIPPAAGIFKMTPKGLVAVESYEEARAAQTSFRQTKKRAGRAKSSAAPVVLPPEVAEALKKVPAGYKVAYDKSGTPRLVKTRKRSK